MWNLRSGRALIQCFHFFPGLSYLHRVTSVGSIGLRMQSTLKAYTRNSWIHAYHIGRLCTVRIMKEAYFRRLYAGHGASHHLLVVIILAVVLRALIRQPWLIIYLMERLIRPFLRAGGKSLLYTEALRVIISDALPVGRITSSSIFPKDPELCLPVVSESTNSRTSSPKNHSLFRDQQP